MLQESALVVQQSVKETLIIFIYLFTEASRRRICLRFLKHWVKLNYISKIINRLINKTETFAGPAHSKTCDGRAMRERVATSGRPDQWK